MPLDEEIRNTVMNYCASHLPLSMDWFKDQFDFVKDEDLRDVLAQEFYAARYIYKLMEALNAEGEQLHAHVKFQIIQYASIYEAVIVYLLQTVFRDEPAVLQMQTHKAYKPVAGALSDLTKMTYNGEPLHLCLYKDTKTRMHAIPFHDKANAAVDIGFLDEQYAEEIKVIYNLRNSIHLETAAKKQVEFEIEQSRIAYRRMELFIQGIKSFLSTWKSTQQSKAGS